MCYVVQMPASTSNSKLVREIHRRRIIAGDKTSFKATTAEVEVFLRYGREPSINDMLIHGSSILLGSSDDDGSTYVVASSTETEWKVDPSIEADNYVFVHVGDNTNDTVGWMTSAEVHQAPMSNGKHVVDGLHMFPMPKEYNFKPNCSRSPCDETGVWDDATDSWDCFGHCHKHRYDAVHVAWWERYVSQQSDQAAKGET